MNMLLPNPQLLVQDKCSLPDNWQVGSACGGMHLEGLHRTFCDLMGAMSDSGGVGSLKMLHVDTSHASTSGGLEELVLHTWWTRGAAHHEIDLS